MGQAPVTEGCTHDDSCRQDREQETADILRAEIPGDRVAVLDYPDHFNSGDLLIYRGQLAYLDRLGIDPA